MRERVSVKNAADREQVVRADRAQKRIAEQFADCLRAVMDTREGRLVCWTYLGKFGVYRTVYADNPQRMAYLAGRQDAGSEMRADLLAAGEDLFQVMEQEMRAMADRDAQAAQVVQERDKSEELQ